MGGNLEEKKQLPSKVSHESLFHWTDSQNNLIFPLLEWMFWWRFHLIFTIITVKLSPKSNLGFFVNVYESNLSLKT